MFKVIHKETNKVVDIYDIRYDAITGYPQFLYYEDGEWLLKSAKHFKPIGTKKKTLNESYPENYDFDAVM